MPRAWLGASGGCAGHRGTFGDVPPPRLFSSQAQKAFTKKAKAFMKQREAALAKMELDEDDDAKDEV